MDENRRGNNCNPAAILVDALSCFFVDELDLRPIDFVQDYSRLARLDLRPEIFAKLVERCFLEIDELRQVQIVEFLEMMAEGGIHLGFAAGGVEHVIIADAFLFGKFNGQQQER